MIRIDAAHPMYLHTPAKPVRVRMSRTKEPKPPAVARPRMYPGYKGRAAEEIISAAVDKFETTRTRILGHCQDDRTLKARAEICQELRKMNPRPSFPKIGKILGIHHTTVMYHCRKVEA